MRLRFEGNRVTGEQELANASEERAFAVVARERVDVEGTTVLAWKVEERVVADGKPLATWRLTHESPFMVYAEVVLSDGRVQRMTGVDPGG